MTYMEQAVLFTNWTNEDFHGRWNGEDYLVPAKTSRLFAEYLTNHFAKHLTDREMNKKKIPTDDQSRAKLLAKCFGAKTSADSMDKVNDLVMNPGVEQKEPSLGDAAPAEASFAQQPA